IARGGRHFHFMWGRYAYKEALGGVLVELDHIAIYRSYWHLLRQARLAAVTAYGGYRRELKMWVLAHSGKNSGLLARTIHASVSAARNLKRPKSHELA